MNDNDANPVGSGNEILLYQTEDGETKIEVKLEGETVWLTQAQMADLFQKSKPTINEHIKNIFKEGELDQNAVTRQLLTTASDGKQYNVLYYNLDLVINVGYRVKSRSGVQFRAWATQIIKNHLLSNTGQPFARFIEMLEPGLETEDKDRSGYVYVVKSPTGYYKIGRTKSPEDRLKTFEVKLPFEVEYVHLISTSDMVSTESDIHKYFAAKRTNGEWFALDEQDLAILQAWQC